MIPSERRPLHKLAIAAGVIVGFSGSLLSMVGVVIAAGVVLGVRGRAPDAGAMEAWFQEPLPLLTFQAISILWLVTGGFTAAKFAGRDHVRHGGWTGAGALVVGLLTLALPTDQAPIPWWSHALSFIVTVPASMLGGYFARP